MAQKISGVLIAGQYIDRGDPATVDVDQTGLTLDGTWNGWDLGPGGAGILPVGATAVELIILSMVNTVKGKSLSFRKNGNTNTINVLTAKNQIANDNFPWGGKVSCDVNGVIEYFGTGTAPGWTSVQVVVRGYYT